MKNRCFFFALVIACGVSFPPEVTAQQRIIKRSFLHSKQPQIAKPSGIEAIPESADVVRLSASEYLVDQLDQVVSRTRLSSGTLRLKMPYRLYGVDDNGTDLNLDIVIDVTGGGMHLSQDETRFEGELQVGVIDVDNPTSVRSLASNPVMLSLTSSAKEIEPTSNLTIDHTNLPFQRLNLFASDPNPVQLKIRSSFSDKIEEATLSVRPTIIITTSPREIDGLGIGTTDVTVQIETLIHSEGVGVTLEANRGKLEKTSLLLDRNGISTTTIRSVGIGDATIKARSAKAASADTSVKFLVPWVFIVCTLAGGLVGSAIRLLTTKKTIAARVVRRLARGILIAVLVTVGYAIGVNFVGIMPRATAGEALTFVVAAVGSYLGKIKLPKET